MPEGGLIEPPGEVSRVKRCGAGFQRGVKSAKLACTGRLGWEQRHSSADEYAGPADRESPVDGTNMQ